MVLIWGLTFVATRWALDDFSPSQLTALRFLIAAAPALVLARPRVPWRTLVPVGLTLFLGQFLLQFFGIALGMPPGLAAVVVQTQALFTILFAALALGERPTRREWTGAAVAFAGLALIATHRRPRSDRGGARPVRPVRGELGRRQRARQAAAAGGHAAASWSG